MKNQYIFVHGISGWGSYDRKNRFLPYWGMFNGDLMKALNKKGFYCHAASVDPAGSAWDRACELYAQLTGTRVDYGKAHSERMHHPRFGEDYSGRALIDRWNSYNKIHLIGHSFGGTTSRMLLGLLAEGDEAERAVTEPEELSGLFTGGKADRVASITTLATPHNGTTAYDTADRAAVHEKPMAANILSFFFSYKKDGRAEADYGEYDMGIDRAMELNRRLPVLDQIYYYSCPCAVTLTQEDGTERPDLSKTERIFRIKSGEMGRFTETTKGGYPVDASWYQNDGLVNTISATAPFGQPQKAFDREHLEPGIWQVMPVHFGDHMSLVGGVRNKQNVLGFYENLLGMLVI